MIPELTGYDEHKNYTVIILAILSVTFGYYVMFNIEGTMF